MGITRLLVENDAVMKILLCIFVLCYIFVITFSNILNVHLVSYNLSITVNVGHVVETKKLFDRPIDS